MDLSEAESTDPALPETEGYFQSRLLTSCAIVLCTFVYFLFFSPIFSMAQQDKFFDCKLLAAIPDSVGFAGSYAGISGNALLVGGGANFPDGVGPWGSTKKTWYDKVFVLETPDGTWMHAGKLLRPMGYGIALTWKDLVICVGGGDAGRHYSDVWTWRWSGGELHTDTLPPLPLSLANATGAIVDNIMYIVGGISEPDARIAQQHFLSLDLTMPKSRMAWEIRPAFPGPPRMLAVAGSHDGSFYVFSGVELYHDVRENKIERRYLKDAYRFNPKNGWETLRDLPEAVAAAPSPAFNAGQSHMLIFGGDDGRLASRVMELKENHPGFSSSVIAYHTGSDTWSETGKAPENASPLLKFPVTTPLVVWNKNVILPGGEIRPGVRTTQVLRISP